MTRGRILAILLTLLAIGCAGPGYYYQAASGHLKLMHARENVAQVLGDPETDPDLAGRLQTVEGILAFADTVLGLPAGQSYDSYVETGRSAVVWNVVATPEFSLNAETWCFPVAGCVPYRGYFDQGKAEKFAAKLESKGLDVAVTPVTAYSTLGWFDDPLLDTMLRGTETQLAATLIHELSHQRLYLKGDTEFNESYASFVELAGVSAWLIAEQGPGSDQDWSAQRAATGDFRRLLETTRTELSNLYITDRNEEEKRKEKASIFSALKREYGALRDHKWSGRDYFSGWFNTDMNNARLALFESYEGGNCAFSNLFKLAGEDFMEFHRLARQRSELDNTARRKWLNQSCSGIASGDDL